MNRPWLAAMRACVSALAPGGARGKLSTLIYHRVMEAPDPLRPNEPTVERFRWQMEVVATLFNVIPLEEAVEGLRNGDLPPKAACVTFDDGYADNAELALPVLQRLGIPVTVFVATGFLNGGRMFNDAVIEWVRALPCGSHDLSPLGLGRREIEGNGDRLGLIRELLPSLKYESLGGRGRLLAVMQEMVSAELPSGLMMRDDQVRTLATEGVGIGAHTVSHPILSVLPDEAVREEVDVSRQHLSELIGGPVRLFAYPNGRYGSDYGDRELATVENLGFTGAVSTHPGVARADSDVFQLPRFTPWDRTPERFALRLMRNLVRQ